MALMMTQLPVMAAWKQLFTLMPKRQMHVMGGRCAMRQYKSVIFRAKAIKSLTELT